MLCALGFSAESFWDFFGSDFGVGFGLGLALPEELFAVGGGVVDGDGEDVGEGVSVVSSGVGVGEGVLGDAGEDSVDVG